MGLTCYRWKADTIKLKGIDEVDDLDKGVGEADDLTWPCLVSTFAYI